MPLPSFLQRLRARATGAAAPHPASLEDEMRARARRRLIGAALLVVAAVIGFPLVFDSQPRPLPGEVAVQVAGGPAASQAGSRPEPGPARSPSARHSGTVVPAPDAGPDTLEPAVPGGREQASGESQEAAVVRAMPAARDTSSDTPRPPAAVPTQPHVERAPAAPADKRETARSVTPSREARPEAAHPPVAREDAARAQALLEGREGSRPSERAAASAGAAGRYVVQVGAFAEASGARDARARVEKLGLKTYTQVVGSDAAKRIRVRVGPYAERAEAERAAAKLKQAGLPAAVLTL